MGIEIARPGQFTNISQDKDEGIDIFKAAYFNRLIDIAPGNLIGYWPLDETAGVTAYDYSGRGHNGTYTGATINNSTGPDGRPVPRFDGINDFCNIYSVSLRDTFDGNNGSLLMWSKVFNAGVWTDGSIQYSIRLFRGLNNYFQMRKQNVNNNYRTERKASGVAKVHTEVMTSTEWFNFAMTWDTTADEVKHYYNGALVQTDTVIGNFGVLLGANNTLIGAASTGGGNSWNGWLAHCAVWNRALGEDDMALIGRV